MIIQGYDISAYALDQPNDEITIDETGVTATRTYLTMYATWLTSLQALYSPFPNYPVTNLVKIQCKQIDDQGELCFVILTFNQRYGPPTTPLPQSQYGINASGEIKPITLHPNFLGGAGAWDASAPWKQFWDASKNNWMSDDSGNFLSTVPSYLIGWTQFPDAGATIWTKVYYISQPLDPIPEGRIVDPGFGFGPSGCYLLTTCDQQKENAFWCRTSHFQYFPLGAPTQIFLNG